MSLRGALAAGPVAVIAEVKRRSPSRGTLDESLDAPKRARQYHDGGARAISVLTEPSEFGGSSTDLEGVRRLVSCPLIKKDFHVLPVQMFEARAIGASAALLIVRALGPDDTRLMADAARQAGVEPVFEVRDETELAWALDAGAHVIGVNRRNLETLAMEPNVISRLIPMIPATALAIAESGINSRVDVEAVAQLGADAVLVGSALSVSPNPQQSVSELTNVARVPRA
jgi:indole-3-glycerol phosphate synthase